MSNRQWASDVADKFESGEWGWIQHASAHRVDGKMCYCLTGGVQTYFGMTWRECACGCGLFSDLPEEDVWTKSNSALAEMAVGLYDTPFQSMLIDFNDQPTTTVTDVVNKLREFARGV